MKTIINILIIVFLSIPSFGQHGIGTNSPDKSAVLDMSSTNKGFLIPRVALTALSTIEPVPDAANALLVFNTSLINDVSPGLYFWDATKLLWTRVTGYNDDVSNDGWINDAQNFVIVTEKNSQNLFRGNQTKMSIADDGRVIIGNDVPINNSAILDLNSTTKGFVLPRLTTEQRNLITEPVAGMMIFNTTVGCQESYINSSKGWFNPCIPAYSSEIKAYFDFECTNLSTFPVGAKIPVGLDLKIENGYAIKLAYTNGNGGTFDSQSFYSTDPYGLTAKLDGGSVNGTSDTPGSGELVLKVLGKATTLGSASKAIFLINLFGRSCPVEFPLGNGSIASISSTVASSDIKYAGFAVAPTSKVTLSYTGGDGGSYPNQSFVSTGVTGLSLTLVAGNFNTGAGTLDYIVTGTPLSIGNASFTGSIGGKTFTIAIPVTAFKNCKEILTVNAAAPSGVYKIDPDLAATGSGLIDCNCDMTTDGGGWTLVLNYVHKSGAATTTNPMAFKLPLLGATSLGVDETGTNFYGHARPTYLNLFNFTELRFYGISSGHSRIMSFKTSFPSMITYFKSGTGQVLVGATGFGKAGTFTPIGTHTTGLPGTTDTSFANQGDNAMTYFPFYQYTVKHWATYPGRYELDDYTNNTTNTLHQIWIR